MSDATETTTLSKMSDWESFYQDLHSHPELAFHETRTAGLIAERLGGLGFEVTDQVGGTGVVGVLRSGPGPTVLLRADMDALPVEELTQLPYASEVRIVNGTGATVPVMHACGHDMHVTCLLAACEVLAERRETWSGTVLAVFQPAEETGEGARAMIDDGLFERFGQPVVVLGQHVAPIPAGIIGLRTGPAFAAADALRVVMYGRGGHGSRPEAAVDPVVMAAATVMRLQTVVSRELASDEIAVLTVGAINAGTAANIIPDEAELLLSIRTYDEAVRLRVLSAIERIVRAEAAAAGAPREPLIEVTGALPSLVNDADAAARTRPALESVSPLVVDPGQVAGSEDVGHFATDSGAPCVYWLLGGADPALFAGASSLEEIVDRVRSVPANHSPYFAPVIQPTLAAGRDALVAAARVWLVPEGMGEADL